MQAQAGPLLQAQTMLTSDPPQHTRLRGLVNKAFTARRLESLRPHIQEIVDELLDAMKGKRELDVIWDLGYPLPVIVIAELLGVPPDHREQFKHWSDGIVGSLGSAFAAPDVQQRAMDSATALVGYFQGVIAERRRAPKDDLISALIAAEEQGQVLSEEELLATLVLLLVAGNETTTNLIGNGTLALLRHPDQLARLRSDPSIAETAVEELLRYDSPVQATGRVATEDIEVGGTVVKEGQVAFLLLGAANRDPAVFPEPDRLDLTRQDNRHVAFGYGIHFCLGAPLARIEAQVALPSLLARFPGLRLATGELEWGGNLILRGLKRLPVVSG
jgi:cytochrome P450